MGESAAVTNLTEYRANRLNPPATPNPLTQRQFNTLQLMGRGLTAMLIGDQLGISEAVVRHELTAIYHALGARNAPHAISIAYRTGLFDGELQHPSLSNPAPQ